jgi:hypothetical protein
VKDLSNKQVHTRLSYYNHCTELIPEFIYIMRGRKGRILGCNSEAILGHVQVSPQLINMVGWEWEGRRMGQDVIINNDFYFLFYFSIQLIMILSCVCCIVCESFSSFIAIRTHWLLITVFDWIFASKSSQFSLTKKEIWWKISKAHNGRCVSDIKHKIMDLGGRVHRPSCGLTSIIFCFQTFSYLNIKPYFPIVATCKAYTQGKRKVLLERARLVSCDLLTEDFSLRIDVYSKGFD